MGFAEHGLDLVDRPREGQTLDAVRVGVLRGGKATFGQLQLAQHVVERFRGHAAVALLSRHDPARADRPRRGARCRRASSRSAGRASGRRPSSGGSRLRARRTSRPPPCGRASGAPSRAPPRRRWRRWSRMRSSIVEAAGNFGAGPKPPSSGSKERRSAGTTPLRRPLVSGSGEGARSLACLIAPRRIAPAARARGGCPRRPAPRPGAPARSSACRAAARGGKYVPP